MMKIKIKIDIKKVNKLSDLLTSNFLTSIPIFFTFILHLHDPLLLPSLIIFLNIHNNIIGNLITVIGSKKLCR